MDFLTGIDVASALPFATLSTFGILVLMLEVFQRPSFPRTYIAYVTAFAFGVTAVIASLLLKADGSAVFSNLAYLDGFTNVSTMLFCLGGGLTALVAPAYLEEHGIGRGEFYALLLFSVAGMTLMAGAGDFVTFFVALEISSIAVYALAAYLRSSPRSAEAGMKYFIVGAFASGVLLYGIALIYGATGTTNFAEIGALLGGDGAGTDSEILAHTAREALLLTATGFESGTPISQIDFVNTPIIDVDLTMAMVGVVMVLIAFLIKIAAAPFHLWAPDAYTGAPTPVVGFMAATVKAAGVIALTRVLVVAFFAEEVRMGEFGWVQVLLGVSLISIVMGNLVAMVQSNVKRMLAYSSIAHAGYLLIGLTALGYGLGDPSMASGIVFYLFAYTIGTVGAFGALAYFGRRGQEVEDYEDLNGLGYKHPWVGAALSVFMLSSAGIPPSAGFMGKFMVFKSAIVAAGTGQELGHSGAGALLTLAILGILASVAGVYYYLKVMVHLYMRPSRKEVGELVDPLARLVIGLCALATLYFGIVPGGLSDLSDQAALQMEGRHDGVYLSPDELRELRNER